jgi:integrase
MPKKGLGKRKVEAAVTAAAGSGGFTWDPTLPGFGVRVHASGRAAYVIQYRDGDGRTRRYTLGAVGKLTPDEARALARKEFAKVAAGGNPSVERAEKRVQPTVRELAELWIERHLRPKRKPAYVADVERQFRLHIFPRLGTRKVGSVTRQDAAELHRALEHAPIQANRTLASLSGLLVFAEREGLRPDGSNPTRYVERFPEESRSRYLSEAELSRLGEVLREIEADESEPWQAVAAVRLLLLTGCRKTEILAAKWADVDFESGVLTIHEHKTSRRKGAKVLPLAAPTLAALAALPRLDPAEDGEKAAWVLPSRNGTGHFIGLAHVWQRIRERAGLPDVHLHDLRHSNASVGVGAGLSLPMIGGLLGHHQAATTERYAHLADHPLRAAANVVAGAIAARLAGSPPAEVVPFRVVK